MQRSNDPKVIAGVVTVLLAALLLTLLLTGALTVSDSKSRTWPPEKHSEIVFEPVEEEEVYVKTFSEQGDNVTDPFDAADDSDFGPSDVDSDEPTQTSYQPKNAGKVEGKQTPPTTTNRASDMTVKPSDKPSGNRKPNAEDEAKAEAARQQKARQDKANEIKSQVKFSGGGKGEGKTSNVDGTNASNGPGGGTGHGMTLSVNQSFKTGKTGVLIFTVTVLPDGSVKPGSASFVSNGSSGQAATDNDVIARAKAAAEQCKFSRQTGETNNLSGRIKFNIKD
jgi:hypothetical protein